MNNAQERTLMSVKRINEQITHAMIRIWYTFYVNLQKIAKKNKQAWALNKRDLAGANVCTAGRCSSRMNWLI